MREEMEANARLIAAAPELLEACKEILAELGYTFPGKWKRQLEAAIAKAQ